MLYSTNLFHFFKRKIVKSSATSGATAFFCIFNRASFLLWREEEERVTPYKTCTLPKEKLKSFTCLTGALVSFHQKSQLSPQTPRHNKLIHVCLNSNKPLLNVRWLQLCQASPSVVCCSSLVCHAVCLLKRQFVKSVHR